MENFIYKPAKQSSYKLCTNWLRRLMFRSRSGNQHQSIAGKLIFVTIACCCLIAPILASESSSSPQEVNNSSQQDLNTFFNHKMESDEQQIDAANPTQQPTVKSSRQSRQYDSSSMSASGTGTYASVSGDGAYVAQLPSGSSAYAPSSGVASAYSSADLSGNYHHYDPMSIARGYSAALPPMGAAGYPQLGSMFPPSPLAGGSSLLSAGSMFPLMGSKGFDVSEIVCTAIAVAIGAVIVGAPFILLYLFVMNQMNGNGGAPGMGPNGGAISLTGPTSSTTVSGRKKRHTTFPEALLKQLSPLVNSEQVAQTFKLLMSSIAKYQM